MIDRTFEEGRVLLEAVAAAYFVGPKKRAQPEHQTALEDDAALIYQEHRPSERQVFYVDVGNMSVEEVRIRLQEIKNHFLYLTDDELTEIEQAIYDDWESDSDPDK